MDRAGNLKLFQCLENKFALWNHVHAEVAAGFEHESDLIREGGTRKHG
jgi:hypothetical protein